MNSGDACGSPVTDECVVREVLSSMEFNAVLQSGTVEDVDEFRSVVAEFFRDEWGDGVVWESEDFEVESVDGAQVVLHYKLYGLCGEDIRGADKELEVSGQMVELDGDYVLEIEMVEEV